jgi:hypothetical protein
MYNHIDSFVSQSRGNESVEKVVIYPYAFDGQDDEVWDKVGQASISTHNYREGDKDEDGEDSPSPAWDILAHILSHMRQKIEVTLDNVYGEDLWDAEESRSFAAAIHGHPTITYFEDSSGIFPYETSDALFSALATLPALESITLSNRAYNRALNMQGHESDLANPESLGALLRVPSLRSVCFSHFCLTRALCEATANALMEGTAVAKLEFSDCYCSDENVDWSPIFLAVRKNAGLKTLKVDVDGSVAESLCTAMTDGLGLNETLESLELNCVDLTDDNAALWCSAFSFLRTNKALKSLKVHVQRCVTDSCISAFRIDIVAMLEENVSLEILSIENFNDFKAEEFQSRGTFCSCHRAPTQYNAQIPQY